MSPVIAGRVIAAEVRSAEYLLIISEIAARGVPNADQGGRLADWSDPYAAFTTLIPQPRFRNPYSSSAVPKP